MRQVVSYIHTTAYKVCEKLSDLVSKLIDFRPQFSVKKSQSSLRKDLVQKHIFSTNLMDLTKNELTTLLNEPLNQNYFRFGNKYYTQMVCLWVLHYLLFAQLYGRF